MNNKNLLSSGGYTSVFEDDDAFLEYFDEVFNFVLNGGMGEKKVESIAARKTQSQISSLKENSIIEITGTDTESSKSVKIELL